MESGRSPVSLFVLDASVAGAWLLDENDPRANAMLPRLETDGAVVPLHWHLEVRSTLLGAERRGRIRADEVDERLRSLGTLDVQTDAQPDLDAALALARSYGLSIYDAVYLELAQRSDAPLATLDHALLHAAGAAGFALIEP